MGILGAVEAGIILGIIVVIIWLVYEYYKSTQNQPPTGQSGGYIKNGR